MCHGVCSSSVRLCLLQFQLFLGVHFSLRKVHKKIHPNIQKRGRNLAGAVCSFLRVSSVTSGHHARSLAASPASGSVYRTSLWRPGHVKIHAAGLAPLNACFVLSSATVSLPRPRARPRTAATPSRGPPPSNSDFEPPRRQIKILFEL